MSVLLRLFAPFLPYITEEAWSWTFAEKASARSVHLAPWPGSEDFTGAGLGPGDDDGVFSTAVAFLEAVRRGKSAAGATVGRHLSRLRMASHPATASLFEACRGDALAAARVQDLALDVRADAEAGSFEVLECVLGEAPPEA
jgi:valyl-tRNA synthetase